MSELVRRANYAAYQHLRERGIHVTRSHLGEIHAALLGYATYAALTLEEEDPSPTAHLGKAQVIALNQESGRARAADLLSELPHEKLQDVIDQCSLAIAECAAPTTVFESIDALFNGWAKEEILALVLDAEDLNPAVRMVLGAPTVEGAWRASGSLWHSRAGWVIEAHGTVREVDDDGETTDCGVVLGWRGRMVFNKAGRAGLTFSTGGATCQYRDPQPDWYETSGAHPCD